MNLLPLVFYPETDNVHRDLSLSDSYCCRKLSLWLRIWCLPSSVHASKSKNQIIIILYIIIHNYKLPILHSTSYVQILILLNCLRRGKKCFIPRGNVKIEWTNYILHFMTTAKDLQGLILGWRCVLLLCRISQRCAEKRSLSISSSHLDRRSNYACHSFSGETHRHPSRWGGGRRARGRSECPSCIQNCRLGSSVCFSQPRESVKQMLTSVRGACPRSFTSGWIVYIWIDYSGL